MNLEMHPERFGEEYMKAVMNFMESVKNSTGTITAEGQEWIIYPSIEDPICCITPARRYRLPPQIIELLKMGSILKLYAYKLTIELCMTISADVMYARLYDHTPWFNVSICTCDEPIGCDRWFGGGEYTICEKCYNDLGNPESCRKTNIWEFNMLDWVCFMYEAPAHLAEIRMPREHGFYVNCNMDSPKYGKVLYINIGSEVRITTVGTIEDLMTHLSDWFVREPFDEYTHNPELYNEECEKYLSEKFIAPTNNPFVAIPNLTGRYVLDHRDDIYTPGMIDPHLYINVLTRNRPYSEEEYLRLKMYAERWTQEKMGKRVFNKEFVDRVLNNLFDLWYHDDLGSRSFSDYMV